MDELLLRPIHRRGLLMGLKSGTSDTAQAIEVDYGMIKVSTGPTAPTHNRNMPSVNSTWASATNTATWAASLNISSLLVTMYQPPAAAGATIPVAGQTVGFLVINAPTDLEASTRLSEVGTLASDVRWKPIIFGVPCEVSVVLGSDNSGAIIRLDILPIATSRFMVEAN